MAANKLLDTPPLVHHQHCKMNKVPPLLLFHGKFLATMTSYHPITIQV